MRSLVILWTSLLLLATAAQATVIDAPHNDSNDIRCGTCHTYSLWWKYSPTTTNAAKSHIDIVDAVCMTCHQGGGSGPMALAHNLTVMNSSTSYTPPWLGEGCMSCHDPHYQAQLTYSAADPNTYLVTAHITDVQQGTLNGEPVSTITYSIDPQNPEDKSNLNWPAQGATATDFDWANKSASHPDRGLVFVHDTKKKSNSFMIVSATSNEVVIKGLLDQEDTLAANCVEIDGQGNPTAGSCDTFGLIYGQLIKSNIAGHAVKFFDPNGGFVGDGTSANLGICQVCHTRTNRYTNDGLYPAPGSGDRHLGRETLNCANASCHVHEVGFKGANNHDSTSFGWAGNCAPCHNPGLTVQNIIVEIHRNDCSLCHVDPDGGGPRRDGPPANGVDGSAIGALSEATCVVCHTKTGGEIHHDSRSNYFSTNNCTPCHLSTPNHAITAPAGGLACADCHALKVVNAEANHATCGTCHHSTAQNVIDTIAAKAPSTCADCHGAAKHEPTPDHQITGTDSSCVGCHAPKVANAEANHASCNTCHQSTVQAVINAIAARQPVTCVACHSGHPTTTHLISAPDGTCVDCHAAKVTSPENNHQNCLTCHQSADQAVIDAIASGLPITCYACHAAHSTATDHSHRSISFGTGRACSDCHSSDTSLGVGRKGSGSLASQADVDLLHNRNGNGCNLCHNYVQATMANAEGLPLQATVDNAIANGIAGTADATCVVCHDYNQDVSHGEHSATDFVWAGNCSNAGCHSGANIAKDVHKNACGSCHVNPSGGGTLKSLALGQTAASSCTMCHATKATSFFNHTVEHATRVVLNTNCTATCHTATAGNGTTIPLSTSDNKVHDTCATCHDESSGALLSTAAANDPGTDATVSNMSQGDCLGCHGAYFVSHQNINHQTRVGATSSCTTSCHTATAGTATTVPVDGGTGNKVHNACADCHDVVTGTYRTDPHGYASAMPAGGGDCVACHVMTFDNHNHSHDVTYNPLVDLSQAAPGTPCASCHIPVGLLTTWAGIQNEHTGGCARCHSYSNADGANSPPLTTNNNTIATGTNVTCVTCHTEKLTPASHGGHDTPDTFVTATATCVACHDPSGAGNYISGIHNRRAAGAGLTNCEVCHVSPGGGGALHDYSAGGVLLPGDTVNYEGINGGTGGACADCHSGGPTTPIDQLDTFSGLTTGQAGGSTFGNWSESAGSDGKLPWMAWTGAAATSGTGPSSGAGGSGSYLLLESSPSTGTSGPGLVTIINDWSNLVNGASTVASTNYTIAAGSDRLLLVAVSTERSSSGSNTFSVTYGGKPLTMINYTGAGSVNSWVGYLKESDIAGRTGNSVAVTPSGGSITGIHVDVISFAGVDQAAPVTDSKIIYDADIRNINLPATTVGEGDKLVTIGVKGATLITFSNTGYTASGVNSNNNFWSMPAKRDASTASTTATVAYGSANVTNNTSAVIGVSINSKPGVAVDFDATNGVNVAAGSSQYLVSNVVDAAANSVSFSFDWNMNVDGNSNAALSVEAFNGSTWNQVAAVKTGSNGNSWVSQPAIDLSSYTNADLRIRIRYVVGTATVHLNDVAVDNLKITSTPRSGGDYHGTYSHAVTTVSNCATTCHTSANVTGTTHGNVCLTCHGSTRAEVSSAIFAGADGTVQNCSNCHASYSASFGTSHTVADHLEITATGASLCTGCHGNSNFISGAHKGNCENCHVDRNSNGSLRGVALTNHTFGQPSGCVTCHSAGFTGHTHVHTLTSVSLCENCHTAYVGSSPISANVHDAGCGTCHDTATDGSLKGSAANATGNENCQGCHSTYFNGHGHSHTNSVKAPTDTSTATRNCLTSGCHTATTAPFIGGGQVHLACTSCHSATTGALQGSANGHPAGGDCVTCHTTYFNGHLLHTTTTHAVLQRATDLSVTAACNTCHRRGGTSSGNPLFTNTWSGTDGIYALHTGDCTVCHNSTRTTNVKAGYASVQAIIQADALTIGCLDCHTDRAVSHGNPHTTAPDSKVTWDTTCQSCHGTSTTPVAAIHTNHCEYCHQNPAGGGPLWTQLGSGTKTCSQCHGFTNSSKAVNISGHHNYTKRVGGANSSAMNGDCIRCHKPNIGTGPKDPATLKMGQLAAGRGLACNFCHLYWNSSTPNTGSFRTDGSGKVIIYKLVFNPNTNPRTPPVQTALTTHSISKVTTGARITNFAACFACHGAVAYTGTAGTSTKVVPFHAFNNHPYTGPDTEGGQADDVINMYAGPQATGATQPMRTTPIIPGFKNFNMLYNQVGFNTTKGYGGANSLGEKHIHDADINQHTPATSTYAGANTFSIPWDNYAVAEPAAPQNITVNVGGIKGAGTIPSTMPTVPLALP